MKEGDSNYFSYNSLKVVFLLLNTNSILKGFSIEKWFPSVLLLVNG